MLNTKYIKPTEGELEILNILWKNGSASVRTVHEEINQSRESGYTTTLKLMQIMYEKGLVERDSSSKVHIYTPALSKDKAQKQLVGKMIAGIFDGSASALVLSALGSANASEKELEQIEKLIADLKKKHG